MTGVPDVTGMAALSICEALLLALNDHDLLPEGEIVGILKDAAAAHRGATSGDMAAHLAVADLIQAIIDSGNSVRRPDA